MGKYLDKTGLQYFYNKLKDKFADKSTIETKLDSLTGAFTWKGELSALPTDLSGYSAGNVIKVGTKEYVCTETNGTKSWDELGDEGSYLLKTAAEDTYFKRTEGDTLRYSIDNIVNDTKNFLTPVEIKIVDSGTYADNIQNIKDYIENLQGDKISIGTAYGYVIPVCGASSEGFLQGIAFCGDDWEQKGASLIWCYASDPKSGEGSMFYYGTIDPSTGLYKDSGKILTDLSELELKQLPTITKSKLATDVQTSLGKADTALQSVPRATLTSDGTVRANQINVPLRTLANSSTSYGGVKVAMGSDGVLGVGWGSKDYFGVVKIGDGLNVSNGLVSIADKSITKVKLDDSVQTSLGKADNSLQIGETNETPSDITTATVIKSNSKGGGVLSVISPAGDTYTTLQGNAIVMGDGYVQIGSMQPGVGHCSIMNKNGITYGNATQTYGSIKVNSNNKLQITGLDTPTSDTDAANKKYVDDKTSDVLKSTTDNSIITDVTLLSDGGYGLSVKKSDDEYIKITPNNITLSCVQDGDTMSSIIYPTKDSGGGNALYVDCTLCGVQEPKSDTDATNKKYVDDKIVSEIYDRVTGYQTEFSDDLETTAYNVVPAINEVNTLAKAAVPKTDLATSLQAITIYIDNTAEHKAANLANIKAYEDNLKALGVDITKSPIIPIVIDQGDCGYIQRYPGEDLFTGLYRADDITTMVISIDSDGNYAEAGLATESDVISYPRQYNYTALTTTSKTVIGAINEVNTLAKSKASTSVATQSANGLMSADDKKKLDGALAAIANNASVNAIDIVSYDETTNTYSGNAIEITGNIKSEIDIKNHTYLAANSTVDGHIESLDIALKNISDKVTNVATAANTAGKDAAAAQSALNTFKNRTEGFATAAQGTKADNSVQYDTNGKDVNLPDDGTLTVFGQITSQIGKLQLGANGESSYDITITSSNIEESPAIVFSESSNDVVLTGVANPINNNDVANKQYVDSKDNSPFIIDLYSVTNYDSSKTYSTTLTKEQVEKIHTNKSFLIKFPETSNDTSTADKIVSVNGGHYVHYETLLDIYDPQHAEKNTLQRITNVCRGMNAQMTKLFTSVANVIINYDANGGVSYTLAISAVITKDLN